ncbi:hypothetical protein ACQKP0_12290 [Heyndrickxia sp. NPDC080065]|uniref:hypothetical protein n=1 Tax=Heyndrickxia sp. NPDC080065 TaxID=3390568 RepID=UPI003D02C283
MRKLISLFFVFLIGCTFLISTAYAKWAYAFVVYNGDIYVISETQIEPNQIGKKIGKVTKYSDQEGSYKGNFSNMFPKGTEYYEIKGMQTKEAIAVKKSEERFIMAKYDGKYDYIDDEYGDNKHYWSLLLYFIGFILLFGIIYLFKKSRNQ